MIKRVASLSLIGLLMCIAANLPVIAQTQSKQEQKVAKIKSKLQKLGTNDSSSVKGKLNDGTGFEGTLNEVGDSDFKITDRSGANRIIRFDEVESIGGKNLSTGAKIAIGVGAGAGAALFNLYLTFIHITRNN